MRSRIFAQSAAVVSFCLCLFLPRTSLAQDQNRGLFVTVLQEPQTLSSREEINSLIAFCEQYRFKNIFIQVYRANKSWFASSNADESPYRACLKNVGEDPLQLLIERAHGRGLKVYAWLNMLSLGENSQAVLLKKYGTGILTTNRIAKNRLQEYKIDSQYFLEPSSGRVRQVLTDIVKEIVRDYPALDGLLFDYIRYPDVRPDYGYAADNLKRFSEQTGIANPHKDLASWQDWKRQQVTRLLQELSRCARSLAPGIKIAATGCAPFYRAYHEAFQDWPQWLKDKTVDFVAFMSYEADPQEYRRSVNSARAQIAGLKDVMLTVGAYKQLKTPQRFSRLMDSCEDAESNGCIVFHYGSLIEAPQLRQSLGPEHAADRKP